MDLIYGDSSDYSSDLPVHLPNTLIPKTEKKLNDTDKEKLEDVTETVKDESLKGDIRRVFEDKEEDDIQKVNEKEEVPPIQGTDVILKSQEDIEEWIKQRKLNWMKRISNKRVVEEDHKKDEIEDSRRSDTQNNKRQRQNDPQQKRFDRQQGNRNQRAKTVNNGVNLNKLLVQREFMNNENNEILEFIKELFNSGVIEKPE